MEIIVRSFIILLVFMSNIYLVVFLLQSDNYIYLSKLHRVDVMKKICKPDIAYFIHSNPPFL